MKIVLNKCYGGFSLSKKAFQMLKNLGVDIKYNYGQIHNAEFGIEDDTNDHFHRVDKRLLKVVEELGTTKSGGDHAELRIVDIPEFVVEKGWEVDEYDGFETIHETHWSA